MVRARDNGEKGGSVNVARTADAPGQALNVDLCFVPATHVDEVKLPAVSGSSGRLVVEQPSETEEKQCVLSTPGGSVINTLVSKSYDLNNTNKTANNTLNNTSNNTSIKSSKLSNINVDKETNINVDNTVNKIITEENYNDI